MHNDNVMILLVNHSVGLPMAPGSAAGFLEIQPGMGCCNRDEIALCDIWAKNKT